MKLHTDSIQSRLIFIFFIIAIMFLLTSFFAGFSYYKNTQDQKLTIQNSSDLVNISRLAQVHFKKQVQEWKNILIRGYSKDDFNKYFMSFKDEEEMTLHYANKLIEQIEKQKTLMLTLGIQQTSQKEDDDLSYLTKTFISQHLSLSVNYRTALENFDENQSNSHRLVDELVQGQDRKPTDLLDSIVERIQIHEQQALAQIKNKFNYELTVMFIAFILIFLVLIAYLFYFIRNQIIHPIYRAKDISREIASGDFNVQVDEMKFKEFIDLFDSIDVLQSRLRSSDGILGSELHEKSALLDQAEKTR